MSTPLHPQATLAQLATQYPEASRVLHRFGLDYCCKGNRSLAAACAERELDPAAVLEEISRAAPPEPRSFESRGTPELVDHIIDYYHQRVREELPELGRMAERVERVHAERAGCPHGLGAHLARMLDELEAHMAKEENVLFPLLRSGRRNLFGPIHVMEAEHRDHGASLEELRRLTGDFVPPSGACATWRALYLRLGEFERELMDHIHLENHVLFPRAIGGE